jgi:hypothetical protein
MKLFKFKSVEPYMHVLDILQNERIYCPTFDQLNDPFEGFLGVCPPKPQGSLDVNFLRELGSYWEEHTEKLKEYRVCSLSKCNSEILMWAHYSAGFQGICIEFELPDSYPGLHKVSYEKDVSGISPESPIDYLTTKLGCWEYENEYRFITTDKKYLDITGAIRNIYIGGRINHNVLNDILNYVLHSKWGLKIARPNLRNGCIEFT